jgi:hypothetical protein
MSDATTDTRTAITEGRTDLGIELGSTRIKGVLIGPDFAPLAVGSFDWENQFVDRMWTYSLDAVWSGVQQCYADLARDVEQRYDVELTSVGALGVSAMMHGYLAFDAGDELLTLFDAHHEDPEFGYPYLLVEEARDAGEPMAERTAWRICTDNRWWSVFGKKRGKHGKVGPPVHDDLVKRDFTADAPNQLWLRDITEHRTVRESCTCVRSRMCSPTGSSGIRSTPG